MSERRTLKRGAFGRAARADRAMVRIPGRPAARVGVTSVHGRPACSAVAIGPGGGSFISFHLLRAAPLNPTARSAPLTAPNGGRRIFSKTPILSLALPSLIGVGLGAAEVVDARLQSSGGVLNFFTSRPQPGSEATGDRARDRTGVDPVMWRSLHGPTMERTSGANTEVECGQNYRRTKRE